MNELAVEEAAQKNQAKLPAIPKTTMTGLMSFVRAGHCSHLGHNTEMSFYSELGSVNVEYNKGLRKTY
jgi:hypothetical protein